MWYHPAAHRLAWREVAGAWLACAMIAASALGFTEFDVAVVELHQAIRALHAGPPAVALAATVELPSPRRPTG